MNPAAAAPALPPDIVHRDFPGWVPPMLVKELRQGLRTRGFVATLLVFQTVMLVLMLVALSQQTSPAISSTTTSMTAGIFWAIIFAQLIILTPMRALGGLQVEVDSRTVDLLMLTRLNAWGVVLGKWISLVAQVVLVLIAVLPYLVVRYYTEGADILGDLGRCLLLLAGSAMLTAAGLWGSGIGKIVRGLFVVVIVWGGGTLGGTIGSRFFNASASSVSSLSNAFSPLELANAFLLGAFFLVSAVRNIAPPAENHAGFARLLPLLILLSAPVVRLLGGHNLAIHQLMVGGGFLAVVLLFELASARFPMASQLRAWGRRGPWWERLGYFAMPGWQSAFVYGLFATLFWTVLVFLILPDGTVPGREEAVRVAGLGWLAFSGLVFPSAVRSFMPIRKSPPAGWYLVFLVLPVIFLALGIGLEESQWKFGFLKSVMDIMPVSGFFIALNPRAESLVFVRFVVAAIVLVVATVQSRAYWGLVATLAARNRVDEART